MAERFAAIRRVLDGHPWQGEPVRARLLDFDVTIRTTDAALSDHLARLYGACTASGDGEHLLSLASTGRAGHERFLVHLDGVRLLETPAPSVALAQLLWEANRQAIEQTRGSALVHAAAVAHGDAAVLLPGPMGAGKSTVAAGLVARGLGYLTDETVALDPATGRVRPYPKYLSLDAAGAALLDLPRARIPAAVGRFVGDTRLVPPEQVRRGCVSGPATPRVVVFPRYEAGAAASLEPVRAPDALLALAEHSYFVAEEGSRVLDALASVVASAQCFRLVSGDLDGACAAVLGLLDPLSAAVTG